MTIKKNLATLFVLSICGIYSQAQADTTPTTTCRLSQASQAVTLHNISAQDLINHGGIEVGNFQIILTDCPISGNEIAESDEPYKAQYVSLRYTGNTNDLDAQGNLMPIQDGKSAHGVAIRLIDNYSKRTINLNDPDSMPKARLYGEASNRELTFDFRVQYQSTDTVSPGYIRAELPFEIVYK